MAYGVLCNGKVKMMISLEQTDWLYALPLPWVAWWLKKWLPLQKIKTDKPPSVIHPYTDLMIELSQLSRRPWTNWPWLWLLGCSAMIIALCQPHWNGGSNIQSHRDYILAIDISGSMRARDFEINGKAVSRLDMLKNVVNHFLEQRQGDRVGVIVFGDEAYTLAPVTADLTLIKQLISNIENGMAGEKTALGTAIALGVQRLLAHRPRGQTLIIFTDGANTTGAVSPLAAMQLAKQNNVHLFTIGIGRNEKVLFPRGSLTTNELTEIALDTALLQRLATETGGKHYTVDNSQKLQQIITDIENIAPKPMDTPDESGRNIFWLPLLICLLLMLANEWRWKIFPHE